MSLSFFLLRIEEIVWRTKFKVHPAADCFPPMSDEELTELAKDIKANGLKNHILVDCRGVLIDGRNRLEAMERAGLPLNAFNKTTIPNHVGLVAEIIAQNIRRRHLTKQQQA